MCSKSLRDDSIPWSWRVGLDEDMDTKAEGSGWMLVERGHFVRLS